MENNNWQIYYNLLKKYYEEHRNLRMSSNYKIKLEDGNKINLGKFIRRQRELYAKRLLESNKIELLNDVGMIWDLQEYKDSYLSDKWLRKYEFAKTYFEDNGNLNIPYNYIVTNEQGSEVKLGEWFDKCKKAYNDDPKFKISEKELELLNLLDPNWCVYRDKENIKNNKNNSIR